MRRRSIALAVLSLLSFAPASAQRPAISSAPETPFKLATFEAQGTVRLGLVLGARVFDIGGANMYLIDKSGLPPMPVPGEMRSLIEDYARVSPRLYQIANYFSAAKPDALPFVFDVGKVAIKA